MIEQLFGHQPVESAPHGFSTRAVGFLLQGKRCETRIPDRGYAGLAVSGVFTNDQQLVDRSASLRALRMVGWISEQRQRLVGIDHRRKDGA